jgi:hypothetical protein
MPVLKKQRDLEVTCLNLAGLEVTCLNLAGKEARARHPGGEVGQDAAAIQNRSSAFTTLRRAVAPCCHAREPSSFHDTIHTGQGSPSRNSRRSLRPCKRKHSRRRSKEPRERHPVQSRVLPGLGPVRCVIILTEPLPVLAGVHGKSAPYMLSAHNEELKQISFLTSDKQKEEWVSASYCLLHV